MKAFSMLDIILAVAALGGLLIALQPILDDMRCTSESREIIASMTAQNNDTNDAMRLNSLRQAQYYNAELSDTSFTVGNTNLGGSNGSEDDILELYEEGQSVRVGIYEDQLSWNGHSTMGWIDIPSIGVNEPIFHGTSDEVLAQGVGHVEWSSLPVGGNPSNCVLAAHSGMRDRSMFDDLDKLQKGDAIVLHTLGDSYQYVVYDKEVVKPREAKDRCSIRPGQDECTLMTCTPYGINSHRLLVHARRTTFTKARANDTPPTVVAKLQSGVSSKRKQPALIAIAGFTAPLMVLVIKRVAEMKVRQP